MTQSEAIDKILLALIGALLSLGIYILRQNIKKLDEHCSSCGNRNEKIDKKEAATDERMNALTWEINQLRTILPWMGDCIMIIGTTLKVLKADAELPPRPQAK